MMRPYPQATGHESLEDLHLPPSFVIDHAIRTLAYHGALIPADMAQHWRVPDTVAVDITQKLRAAGLVELVSGQTTFEASARVQLTKAGEARVSAARARTWYAGPLPVESAEFVRLFAISPGIALDMTVVMRELEPLGLKHEEVLTIARAVAAGAAIGIAGLAPEEMPALAAAIADALTGDVMLPYALFTAGSVVRIFDPRYHHAHRGEHASGELDIMRTRSADPARWVRSSRPAVVLAGGIDARDSSPGYDHEAHLYVAPAPFMATGGMLAVMDADARPGGLTALARSWLLPGRSRIGVMHLLSGERVEVPWQASVLLFVSTLRALHAAAPYTFDYRLDVAQLDPAQVPACVRRHLSGALEAETIGEVASALAARAPLTRTRVAAACRYIRDATSASIPTASLASVVDEAITLAAAPPALGAAA